MLRRNVAYPGPGKTEQVCRVDYEKLIADFNIQLDKSRDFLTAIRTYFDEVPLEGHMAELVGELVSEQWSLIKNRDRLIKQQEEEEGKE